MNTGKAPLFWMKNGRKEVKMMGLSFSNIQIRRTENEPDFAQIAAILTEGRDISAVDSEEEADIMLSVFTMSDSPWITVCSDLIEGDFEELGAKARRLSETLQTQTLALACLDSDYFCMNLIDAANGAAASFQSEDDVAILNEEAAWQLFGSNQCIGEYITVGEEISRVLAVIAEPQGSVNARAFGGTARIYTKITAVQPVTFYELILPEYYTGFAEQTVQAALGTAVITDCTDRFRIAALWTAAISFFFGAQQEAVNTPPWEFSAQQTQRHLCLLAALCIMIGVSLLCLLIRLVLREIRKMRNRKQSVQAGDTPCEQENIVLTEPLP